MRERRLLNLMMANAKKGTFNVDGNTIFIYDIIVGSDAEAEWFGGVSPQAFAIQLASLKGAVTIRIDSPGGDVFAARAMQQAIREHGDVTCIVDGVAASAASLIAVTGNKTQMAPGSMMMIHEAWTFAMGNKGELRQTADFLDQIDVTIAETYAHVSGKTADEFAPLMVAETWFTAQGAVDFGLADEVLPETKKTKSNNAKWDLKAYDHAPAQVDEPETQPEQLIEELDQPDLDAENALNEIERRQRIHAARMLQKAA